MWILILFGRTRIINVFSYLKIPDYMEKFEFEEAWLFESKLNESDELLTVFDELMEKERIYYAVKEAEK